MIFDFYHRIVKKGTLSRSIGPTDMNASSSRSHAILSLILRIRKGDGQNQSQVSRFHFVDLAGSERLKRTNAQGTRAKEAIAINGGLLALGNVISALSHNQIGQHVPYRDSKLTRLLQNALGGNSCTLMIACISPDEISLSESINTLKYAARAKNIRNKAQLNEDHAGSSFELAQLRKQIMNLKKENLELRALARLPGDTFTAIPSLSAAVEGNIAALRATYEAKVVFLQETISKLKRSNNLTNSLNVSGGSSTTAIGNGSLSKVSGFSFTLRR